MFLLLPVGMAFAFPGVQLTVFGVYMGASFAPNHKGMPVIARDAKLDFFSKQVRTSRNCLRRLVGHLAARWPELPGGAPPVPVVALGAGAAVGVALASPGAPAVLGVAPTITSAPVTTREYDDARPVAITVTTGTADQILAPASGRVTASVCADGAAVASGQTLFSIDGAPLVALATAVAPWRDLTVRDRGTDVQALNDELRRLGLPAPEGERVTTATVASFRQLVASVGGSATPLSVIPQSMIAWLPAPTLTIGTCDVPAGAWVQAGEEMAASVVPIVGARVTDTPTDAVPGDRLLQIDTVVVATDADGAVTDSSSLSEVATSTAYQRADVTAGAAQLNGTWRLATPVNVWVVPPGAIFGLQGSEGCVASGGDVHPVRVVGSELGQSFVVPTTDEPDIETVDTRPAETLTCQ